MPFWISKDDVVRIQEFMKSQDKIDWKFRKVEGNEDKRTSDAYHGNWRGPKEENYIWFINILEDIGAESQTDEKYALMDYGVIKKPLQDPANCLINQKEVLTMLDALHDNDKVFFVGLLDLFQRNKED